MRTLLNRRAAGRLLAVEIGKAGGPMVHPIVLALPRGGVPVGHEVARETGAPLDVLVVRKIGMPGNPEVGIGAVVGDAPPLFDDRVMEMLGLTEDELMPDVARERAEAHRREVIYRRHRPEPRLEGRTVILVDDGLATGVTARAAVRAVRTRRPGRVVLAVPVGARQAVADLAREADRVVCPYQPYPFRAVGQWYDHFDQVPDEEVIDVLDHQWAVHETRAGAGI
ncbi:phosphoribosyltransferase [Streptomyces sp. NPDC048603]|uniref:phosphoribosyltransferase n=1 Tax=Streptomyces sp. NPDC048603 TaxID=3365577 RepID=UPI0037215716